MSESSSYDAALEKKRLDCNLHYHLGYPVRSCLFLWYYWNIDTLCDFLFRATFVDGFDWCYFNSYCWSDQIALCQSIDIWGRAQGFAFMVLSITIGTIMMAGCNNVKTYCAAQVFYWVGYNGIDFTITIFIADTTKLKNRAFILAYTSSCYIATVWAYGPAAESILNTIGFRWGFGIWAIIIPVVCSPLFGLLYYYQQKAVKVGFIPKREKSGRTFWQSVVFYGKEFDVIGIFILALGLALFLLGFNLYSYQKNEWRSPLIICFLIIGGLLIISFGIWEYFAPVSFIPWELLTNRTVIFTYSMAAAMYCSFYIWDSYFFSFIIVVFNLSTARATYITNIYSIGSCFCALVVGVIIRCYGRLKSIALFWGVLSLCSDVVL